jgi:3-oxoacyl-[acyl-carrier-protein] synthase III
MSLLRDRRTEDLRLRGRARNTIDTYVRCVRQLIEWACTPPTKIDAVIVRASTRSCRRTATQRKVQP